MNVVVAADISTLMWCSRDSLLASPTVVPASTEPIRWVAPVCAKIASSKVVLLLWNGPTSAIHRGPEFDLGMFASKPAGLLSHEALLWGLCFQSEWPLASGRSRARHRSRIGLPGAASPRCAIGKSVAREGATAKLSSGGRRSAGYDGTLLPTSGSRSHRKS